MNEQPLPLKGELPAYTLKRLLDLSDRTERVDFAELACGLEDRIAQETRRAAWLGHFLWILLSICISIIALSCALWVAHRMVPFVFGG